MANEQTIERVEELGEGDKGTAALWGAEIKSANKYLSEFKKDAKHIEERYLDKRGPYEQSEFRVNLFWSTMQVVLSSLYAQPPKADAKRLYDDPNDEASRVGGEILGRLLNNDIQRDGSSSNAAIRTAVQDWSIVGMGQVWARYDVHTTVESFDEVQDPVSGAVIMPAEQIEKIENEDALIEWVHWDDFLYSPARVWEEVRWVSRRVYMTREQLIARFGEDIGKRVPMGAKPATKTSTDDGMTQPLPKDPWNRAEVYEIWDKRTKMVYWYNKGCDYLLDQREDPLELTDFFPCPAPMMANLTSSALLPRPDYIMAQGQFEQMDELNTRATWLTRAMKVVGVYDKTAEGVQRMLSQAIENQLIPVDNWAMFAEAGGVKGKIDWLPLDTVANTVERLRAFQESVKAQIYEVLGISDIMRGSTKASETASAQQIKAQFGSTRMQLKQFAVAKFVQQALGIKSEIICRWFQPETIVKRSNIMLSPDAQYAQPAIELLKNVEEARYRIQVEADSMSLIDRKAQIDSYTGMLTAVGQAMQQATPLIEKVPEAAPAMFGIIKSFIAKFQASEELEGMFDQAINALQQKAAQPQQPDPVKEAEVQEKLAGAVQRKASAVKSLADAEVATLGAMLPFPAPPEQFVNGMPQPVPGQQPMGGPVGPAAQPPMGGAPVPQGQPPMPPQMMPPAQPPMGMPQ